jgi:hypothetical protein
MIIRKLGDKKHNVVLFQGSPRDKETCSGELFERADQLMDNLLNYLNLSGEK